ncbi:MAG: lysyl-tRNA synthetase class 2 [Kiritimatiellia bacterium]|jgi:elongation factor P--(R)-beta-lysine ligase
MTWAVRRFFHNEGYVEIDTPVRIAQPAMELHIDAEPSGTWYLRTSPELHMKRLLAEGHPNIFQIGPCFRTGEYGERHRPEFTLLEWYRTDTDAMGILDETQRLLHFVAAEIQRRQEDLEPWEILDVAEAFERHAGWNPVEAFDADRFDLDLVDQVEPALSREHPVVLKNYPAELGALARINPDDPRTAERWELYLGGLEIANAYTELTDPVEQRRRFEAWGVERAAMGKAVYGLDEAFLEALTHMPPAGGIALGMDRLAMFFCGSADIGDVMSFS